jgi:hypothetical protein
LEVSPSRSSSNSTAGAATPELAVEVARHK